MLHEDTLIATLALSLAFAFLFGLAAVRLHLSPLVGYLLAGVALSPYTPGLVADPHIAPQLAEIGVMLLMFGVGTHFSLRDLLAVRSVAVPGALAQIAVATALGVAYGSAKLFGVSVALGAFFAGMVISGTDESHTAATYLQPLRDMFAALFFVAVGMLFESAVLIRHPLEVLEVLAIVVVGKSVAAVLIVRLLGRPLATALTVAAALAQIGEFSFILAVMGVSLKLLPPEGQSYIVAGALFSIVLNPVLFALVGRFLPRQAAAPA